MSESQLLLKNLLQLEIALLAGFDQEGISDWIREKGERFARLFEREVHGKPEAYIQTLGAELERVLVSKEPLSRHPEADALVRKLQAKL